MNPEKALASWAPVARPAGAGDIAAAWARATGLAIGPRELVLGKGVRELLTIIFGTLRSPELWLPEDVYPVYWELARASVGFEPAGFRTLAGEPWAFLERAGPRAQALLPIPLSPLGRWPSRAEIAALVDWLGQDEGRGLLVDAVYTYDFAAAGDVLRPLLATDRCGVLWSCSKSWLRRDVLGIGRVPEGWAPSLQRQLRPEELAPALALLDAHPGLPSRQAQAFRREWQRLAPLIRRAAPDWQPPQTGYFSTVALPAAQLLEHDLLAVPASVFGGAGGLSVVSCLHDLVQREREGA
jgi:hypothetical protein